MLLGTPIICYSDPAETQEIIEVKGDEVVIVCYEYGKEYKRFNKTIASLSDDIKAKLDGETNQSKPLDTKGEILKRINELKTSHNNFPRTTMRWKGAITFDGEAKYFDEIKFDEISNASLILVFELMLRRHYLQM